MKVFCLVAALAFAAPALAADVVPPEPPVAVQAEYVPHFITLTWSPSPSADIAEYRVYRDSGCDVLPGCEPTLEATRDPLDVLTYTGPYGEIGFGGPLTYWVTAVDTAGNESPAAGPSLVDAGGVELRLAIASPAPNPSRGEVALAWTTPAAGRMRVAVFDLAGREVRALVDRTLPAGVQRTTWDGKDQQGRTVRPGAYFARFESPWGVHARMLVRIP
jgi:FlgD Ig-like domain